MDVTQWQKLGSLLTQHSQQPYDETTFDCPAPVAQVLRDAWEKQGDTDDYSAQLLIPEFLAIHDKNRTWFGGNQQWYANNLHNQAGCGTVAAADLTAYAGLFDEKENLYAGPMEKDGLTVDGFMEHMHCVVEALAPTCFGIPWVPYWQRGMERYTKTRGYRVEHFFCLHGDRRDEPESRVAEAYLLQQIAFNRPVACIHWGGAKSLTVLNPSEVPEGRHVDMNYHWVVVTAIQRIDNEACITVSSFGHKYELLLKEFLCGKPSFVATDFARA